MQIPLKIIIWRLLAIKFSTHAAIAAFVLFQFFSYPATSTGQNVDWSVCFTPGGKCTDTIVQEIAAARNSIRVQAYSFTSAVIAKALVAAHRRGVDVKVILDKSQRTAKYSSADFLANAGVPTWIDDCCAIAHNKVIVIDGQTVITGSFNFTKAAQERNAENLLLLRNRALADRYTTNWEKHLITSTLYMKRTK